MRRKAIEKKNISTIMSNPSLLAVTEELQNGILINYAICGVLGICLNASILVILIPKVRKSGAHADTKICLFIAIVDTIISFGMLFRSIFLKYPYNLIKYHDSWCKADVLIMAQLLLCSGYSLAVMAIERCSLVCFNIKLSAYFWFGLLASLWIVQLSFASVCAYYNYNMLTRTETYCTFSVFGACKPTYFVSLSLFYISFFSISICYFGIMAFKIKQCLNQIQLNVPKEKVYSELRSTLAKSLINILIYYLVFSGKVFIYTYETITGKKRTLEIDIVSHLLVSYTSVANASTLLYMNSEIRKNLFTMLKNAKSKLFDK
jgi:hypothetical protein